MIYIEEKEKVPLPKKYHKINNLCAIIYDQLTEIFSFENYKPLGGHKLEVSKQGQVFIEDLESGKIHLLDWLKANELNDEITNLLCKHLTMSITHDMVNFIYESLSCAKRGKMTVAYALLRKPFTDELLILEQLLFDPHEFINRFYHLGNPSDYDPSNPKIDKGKIIENALLTLKPKFIFNKDLLYELRFDKSSQAGINGKSNHALHIVTNDRNYKTENNGLNFIFSQRDDIDTYWDHYYYIIPYLLIYTVAVVDSIIFRYLPGHLNEEIKTIKSFRRIIGLLLWAESIKLSKKKDVTKMFKSLSIKLDCLNCKEQVELIKPDFVFFFESEIFLCPNCFENLLTNSASIIQIKKVLDSLP